MKKLALAFLAFGLTSSAFARGGNGRAEILTRNSKAWQLAEASEFALRTLVTQNANWLAEAVGVESWHEGTTVFAEVEKSDGTFVKFACAMVRELSQGGTVARDDLQCGLAQ